MSESKTPKTCRNCGSANLTWHCDVKNYGGVQDGRIRLHEVGAIAFLGCDDCSETLKTIDSDSIAKKLNTLKKYE